MTSNSDDSYVEISVNETPVNRQISEIACSPNLKHVAALHENNDISLWSIVSQEELLTKIKTINIDNISRNEKIVSIRRILRIFAISDNKQVSISLDRIDPYNFKIFDFETPDKEIKLKFPDWQKEIDILSFRDNGNIIMVNAKYYRAYVFSIKGKDNMKWVCKSMVELQYFKKIYITTKGKLILFNDTIYEIMMWDIEKLSVETRILIDWNRTLESVEISDDEKLFVVCAKNEETMETSLYVYSTETGINLASMQTKLGIDRFHLIASQKGERLLIINISKKRYSLLDPYHLKNPISASSLFENIKDKQIQEPYIIKSDKLIYTIDGEVLIEKLVDNDWVECLRKKLKDTNSITAPSEMTIETITKIINYKIYEPFRNEFEGKFLKWSLELIDGSVKLIANKLKTSIKKELYILPLFYVDANNFIVHCEVLENDDFVTITRIGVIIWTYKLFGIKMHYYWNDWNDRLENFVFEMTLFKSLFKDWKPGRILPVSNYETILKNLDIEFGKEKAYLFEVFLKDNITEEFYLTCYGKDLMEALIKQKDDKLIRFFGQSCIDKCILNNNHLISRISLLSIIFENFNELSNTHPSFIASTLSSIEFVVPGNIVNTDSTSSYISSYGKYCHLSKTSYLDILFPNIWNPFISFFQRCQKYVNQVSHSSNHSSVVLAIPLPNFVSYPKEYKNFWNEFWHPKPNCFTYLSNNQFKYELYKHINGEALLDFKWNTYGRKYYLTIWAIYTIFLGSFIIVSTLSDNISWFYQQILLYIIIILGFWHLFIEFRQLLIYSPLNYLLSSWNYLDLAATISTTATSIYWLKNGSASTWAITFSTLFVEIKFIIFFRPIKFFGIYLAMIMNTVDRVISFLIIFGFLTLAFAHSLHLLLRSASETSRDSSINMFGQFGSAIIASYYMMITGDTDPVSFWISNENIVIMILMIMVSFFMLIYLMNLFIGILSEIVSNGNHELAYLALKREIIVEIELLYMLPYQRRKKNWFPYVIFYECDTIKLRDHILDIQYNKRPGDKMPYFSKKLKEVLLLSEEHEQIEEIIEKDFTKVYKYMKGLPTCEYLKELIKDLPTHNDIKDLKKLIEDLKTNK
ncbi:transient receptor potential cation channel subfamily a member 1-like [Gigaspora margarita]|uniref:Transient receptor potential cation channel subfamily a member 1-like n=1 Tax=Gigaspora margarita TaxID=4874 RepID=A0A8H4ALU3_GIGMA|nr:transient receptor potential cation channel subfamily a member 1-like [Gigaspora margarita]